MSKKLFWFALILIAVLIPGFLLLCKPGMVFALWQLAAVLLAAGVAAVFFFRNGENGGTADRALQMQNIALKTENTALQQQSEAEKKLLQDSFEREKELLCANHRQEIELLNSHFVARTDEQEKAWQQRLQQLESSSLREKELLTEKHAREMKLLQEHYERTFAELEKSHQTRLTLLKEEFKVLSDRILEEKSGKLQSANKEQLENLLNPLKEKMNEFKNAVEESKNKGIELNTALTTQLGKMMEETHRIGGEARSLVNALKGEQKTQGDWGELILEDILQRSGLREGLHYECQETIRDSSGKTVYTADDRKMRPDVIVHYPDGKDVIIDSKVSLTAYVDYMNSDNEESRKDALARHIRSIRNHVNELAKKDYSVYNSKSGRDTVDFVIMFVPNEGPFQLAMISEPALWHEAFKNKVMLVSPTNLMALLKIIHISWTREEQSRNQQEILDTAATLLDRLYAFYDDFDNVGTCLARAQTSFEAATRRLKQGERNRSIVNTGDKLKKLGVRMNKQRKLPLALQIEEEADPEDSEPAVEKI